MFYWGFAPIEWLRTTALDSLVTCSKQGFDVVYPSVKPGILTPKLLTTKKQCPSGPTGREVI